MRAHAGLAAGRGPASLKALGDTIMSLMSTHTQDVDARVARALGHRRDAPGAAAPEGEVHDATPRPLAQ